jgi:hypothetical protein
MVRTRIVQMERERELQRKNTNGEIYIVTYIQSLWIYSKSNTTMVQYNTFLM